MEKEAIDHLHIAISGIIGVGKTKLATALGKAMGVPPYYEPVDGNPYLAPFYANMTEHAFALQIHLLNVRFEQQQEITRLRRGAVQDRSVFEDTVFAKMLCNGGHMSRQNLDTYTRLFQNMSQFMHRPNLIVFLDVPPDIALARIKERGRECEQSITLAYMEQLHAEYLDFITEIAGLVPVVHIDYSTFPPVEKVVQAVRDAYARSRNVPLLKVK
jgi:deoxyadenosine kinase